MMSAEEVRVVKWVEWVLAPLLVVSVLALGKCTASAQEDLIILQRDVAQIDQINGDTKNAIKAFQVKQSELLENQHQLEKQVTALGAHQSHIKEDISEVKEQNTEILRLLRTNQ